MLASLRMLLLYIVLLGGVYPLLMTGIGQLLFRDKVQGSLIIVKEKIRGSALIGQKFSSPTYFWGRPSAVEYDGGCSGATNLSPTNEDLIKAVTQRRESFRKENNIKDAKSIPADMLFCSGSGLDPDISPETAYMQVERIVKERKLSPQKQEELVDLVKSHTLRPTWGFLGESRVNVLRLNLALDKLCK